MTHQLITLSPLARVTSAIKGSPPRRELAEGQSFSAPEGHTYVPVLPAPEGHDPSTHVLERHLTFEADGWLLRDLTPEELAANAPRPPAEVGSGQIRAAMIALGLAADDEALDVLITGIIANAEIPAGHKAIARALWRYASVFRRDHEFIGLVQAALGKNAAFMDQLFFTADTF